MRDCKIYTYSIPSNARRSPQSTGFVSKIFVREACRVAHAQLLYFACEELVTVLLGDPLNTKKTENSQKTLHRHSFAVNVFMMSVLLIHVKFSHDDGTQTIEAVVSILTLECFPA